MKKMKIAGFLLACALPFSASAAEVCLRVNNGNALIKFTKPKTTKAITSAFQGTLIIPAI